MEKNSNSKDNAVIKHKIEMAVRFKPLGAGAGEIEWPSDKYANKKLGGYDAEKNTVLIEDKKNAKCNEKFAFDKVISDKMNQEDTYNALMPKYVQYFVDGYNTNVLAYG